MRAVDPRYADVVEWRRDIHAHPELQFEVDRTASLVASKLREFGCDEVVTGIGRTGVVGVIHGNANGSGKVIGLRADMDALPIEEETGMPWASRTKGVMHACGHDGHTAMLLGAARELAQGRAFNGTVAVVFQPAEEGGGGGKAMVDDGLMDRFGINEIYAMHTEPALAIGRFATTYGPFAHRRTRSGLGSTARAPMVRNHRTELTLLWWAQTFYWRCKQSCRVTFILAKVPW